jgi:hypothetical protein
MQSKCKAPASDTGRGLFSPSRRRRSTFCRSAAGSGFRKAPCGRIAAKLFRSRSKAPTTARTSRRQHDRGDNRVAFRPLPTARRPVQIGCMKSNMTAIGRWRAVIRSAFAADPQRLRLGAALPADRGSRSCLIDGQTVACDDNGMAVFKLLNQERHRLEAARLHLSQRQVR